MQTTTGTAHAGSWSGRLAEWGPSLGVLLFHLTFLRGYGVFRDELYYIACGKRPGWGYVDHPPLVGWVAWAVRQVFGDSHLALRVVAALAAAAAVWVTARIARELGGGTFAVVLAGLGSAVAPIMLALGSIYSMNAFDLVFWAVLFWIVTRILRGGDERLWIAFGAVAGLGLLDKISVLFVGFGIVVGLVLSRRFDVFRSRFFWAGGAIAFLVFLPHLVWQQAHGWPTLEFMRNARQEKMVALPVTGFLRVALDDTTPVAWLWIFGVGWLLLARAAGRVRTLGFAFLAVLALLATTGGKPYYLAAGYAAPLAAGAVAVEAWTERARRLRPVLATLVVVVGLALSPLAAPVLPVDDYVRYAAALGQKPATDEHHELARLPQFYADMHGWRQMAQTVASTFRTLPPEERAKACVFGQNYGEAGAIEYFGPGLGLPPAISAHNSYWIWGPGRCTAEVLLVIGDRRDRLDQLFESVEEGGTFHCRDCMPYENGRHVWIARRLKVPLAGLWPEIKHFI
jgi:hypothetical protein